MLKGRLPTVWNSLELFVFCIICIVTTNKVNVSKEEM